MLKEQQAAFQLVIRAGGSGGELMHRYVTVNKSSEARDVWVILLFLFAR